MCVVVVVLLLLLGIVPTQNRCRSVVVNRIRVTTKSHSKGSGRGGVGPSKCIYHVIAWSKSGLSRGVIYISAKCREVSTEMVYIRDRPADIADIKLRGGDVIEVYRSTIYKHTGLSVDYAQCNDTH